MDEIYCICAYIPKHGCERYFVEWRGGQPFYVNKRDLAKKGNLKTMQDILNKLLYHHGDTSFRHVISPD